MIAIEFREMVNNTIITDLAFIASSTEKAEEFIQENKHFSKKPHWWWATYEVEVDEKLRCSNLTFYSKDGKNLGGNQPY